MPGTIIGAGIISMKVYYDIQVGIYFYALFWAVGGPLTLETGIVGYFH